MPPMPNSMLRVSPCESGHGCAVEASVRGVRQAKARLVSQAHLLHYQHLSKPKISLKANRMPFRGHFEDRRPQIASLKSDIVTCKSLMGDIHL
jgi:hypothetical protein